MADQPLHLRSDADLESALRGLGEAIAWPAAVALREDGADLAAIVRGRIEAAPGTVEAAPRTVEPRRSRRTWWPASRALAAAVLILLALAALAAAAGLGLPGLRLLFGPVPVSPPPSLAPRASPETGLPGSTLGLGALVALEDLDARAGFDVTWPSDPALGPPDAAYVDPSLGGQVALVWRPRADIPDTLTPGVGLVLTEFRGSVDSGFLSKAIGSDVTVKAVRVNDGPGFWLTGDPHFLFYTGPDGFVHDPRRWVGDALLWASGPITYRLETSVGEEAARRIADSMP
jgi:hypothetical protein